MNHLERVSSCLPDGKCCHYELLVASIRNFNPWALVQERIVSFDNDQAAARRDGNCVWNGIFLCVVEAWGMNEKLWFLACCDGHVLEYFGKLYATVCVERKWSAASSES
jgi:hypothetical protein